MIKKFYYLFVIFIYISLSSCNNSNQEKTVSYPTYTNKYHDSICNSNLNVEFDTSEKTFTFMSWMNFVADIEEYEKKYKKFPEHIELINYLKEYKPKKVYSINKKSYINFLKNSGLYEKNGLLIMASDFYSSPPEFSLNIIDSDINKIFLDSNLPSSETIKEFYQTLKINELWKNKYKQINDKLNNRYRNITLKALDKMLCDLKTEQIYPTKINLNTLGYFGIAGQTTFLDSEKKYLLKINPSFKSKIIHDIENIKHEFAHSLFNNEVSKNRYLITEKIKKVSKALNIQVQEPEEMIAQCIESYDRSIDTKKSFIIDKNILIFHFKESFIKYKKSVKPFKDFIPILFETFDTDKEIYRLQKIL